MQVFIPVCNAGHKFLVVFNLKKGEVLMLDSKAEVKVETKKKKKTGNEISTMKSAIDIDVSVADDSMAIIVVFLTINSQKCFISN